MPDHSYVASYNYNPFTCWPYFVTIMSKLTEDGMYNLYMNYMPLTRPINLPALILSAGYEIF